MPVVYIEVVGGSLSRANPNAAALLFRSVRAAFLSQFNLAGEKRVGFLHRIF